MRRVAIGMVLAVAVLVVPGAAWGHNAGRVELLVTNLEFSPLQQGIMVGADLIDRDSGASAAGFAIDVSAARGTDGGSVGPVTLTDARGTGHYEGVLTLGPGSWTVTAKAGQGTSALPALGSTRTATVKLDSSGALTPGGSHGRDSHVGLWIALGAAVLVLAAGVFLMMTRQAGGPTTAGLGQRVA